MELKESLGTKLKKLRASKNMSQNDVAKHLHITRQTVSAWENDKSQPDLEVLIQLCDLYDTSLDDLYEVKKGKVNTTEKNHPDNENEQKISDHKMLYALEQVCLSALAAIFCMFPYVGVIAPIGIMIWMFVKKKRYPVVFIVCIMALFVGFNNTRVIMGQMFDIGEATIEKIE